MAEAQTGKDREGLSLQTLVIAAIASATAAVVVSKFWQDGTVVAAAMTPVIVSITREMLHRPMQSEVVKRAASRVTELPPGRVLTGAAARSEDVRRRGPTASQPPPPTSNGAGQSDVTPGDVVLSHPRRTYSTSGAGGSRSRLRGPRMKLAVVTGLIAFVIAALVLTVPELLFGGSVSSGESRTTLFGGGDKSQSEKKGSGSDEQDSGGQAQPDQPAPTGEEEESEPAPDDETQPQPATPEAQPQAPPSSGGTAPPAQSPAPAPSTP
jgi:hypothetical protein